jgi:hypothetical protein
VLRAVALVLVAANLLFFAFSQGWLDGLLGLRSLGDREPDRLGRQVRPEAITLWPAPPAGGASTEPTACYEAGPFVTVDAVNVEATLRANLPPGSWAPIRSDNAVGSAVVTTLMYRVAAADPALVARLTTLRLDPNGRGFSPCPDPTRPR